MPKWSTERYSYATLFTDADLNESKCLNDKSVNRDSDKKHHSLKL